MSEYYNELLKRKIVDPYIDKFLDDLFALFDAYDISISHEDTGGCFILEKSTEENKDWMRHSSVNR